MTDQTELLTIKEYAEHMRVTPRTVERWIHRKLLDAFRHGPKGQWRIRVCTTLSEGQAARLSP